MKMELGISAMSSVISASGCPSYCETACGIMYRM